MADNKEGRENQAQNEERRQRERELATALERGDEPEPPLTAGLGALERELDGVTFPATGNTVVGAAGDHEIEASTGSYTVGELVPETAQETFDSPAAVTAHLLSPTVAAGMKRVLDTVGTLPNTTLQPSQRKAYEKTFGELRDIDTVDNNEGIGAISDWIVEYIHEKERLPGSRAVRRQAATFCRANNYQVRNDEWLGI